MRSRARRARARRPAWAWLRAWVTPSGTYARRSLDQDRYRAQAGEFTTELMREHYLHFSGQKDEFEIEPIYERHAPLFSRDAVEELRGTGNRELTMFAVQGLMGQETKADAAEMAR